MPVNLVEVPLDYDFKARPTMFWCSDLHMDSHEFDRKFFKRQFSMAQNRGDRIFIFGDLVEGILPKDPRYTLANDIHPKKQDLIKMIKDYAVEMLLPYVNSIDVIGCGNHETAMLKHNFVDITRLIIDELNELRNEALPPIIYSGYHCLITIRFNYGGRVSDTISAYVAHGVSNGGEVSKYMIPLDRLSKQWATNIIAIGHTHYMGWTGLSPLYMAGSNGHAKEFKRDGVALGCFKKDLTIAKVSEGFEPSFGGEKMLRRHQSQGGIRITFGYVDHRIVATFHTIK